MELRLRVSTCRYDFFPALFVPDFSDLADERNVRESLRLTVRFLQIYRQATLQRVVRQDQELTSMQSLKRKRVKVWPL